MNWLDIVMLAPIAWWGFKGFRHGFVYEIFSLLALIVGFWAAIHFSDLLLQWLEIPLAKTVSFSIILFATIFLVRIAGRMMQKVVRLAIPKLVDHLLGLLFGVAKVILICSMAFYFINMVDKNELLIKREVKEASMLYKHVEPIVPEILVWKNSLQNNENHS